MSNDELRKIASTLLIDGKVKYFLGNVRGADGFAAKPICARTPEEANELIWDPSCVNNMASYLHEDKKRIIPRGQEPDTRPIGIFVKGCDSRSVALHIQEHIFEREQIHIVGVTCRGVVDVPKLKKAWMKRGLPVAATKDVQLSIEGSEVIASFDGKQEKFAYDDVIMERCKVCRYPNPVIHDDLIGEQVEPKPDAYPDLEEMEAMSPDERWAFWTEQFSACVRCLACRNVCPACYCRECSVQRSNPAFGPRTTPTEKMAKAQYANKTPTMEDNFNFHMSRMYHMTGRCTNCGECDRVCPVGIPLRLLTRKMDKDVREVYDHEPGLDTEPRNLLAEYRDDDPEGDFL